MEFFILTNSLWRKDPQSRHKLVVPTHRRIFILSSAHDDVGHKGFCATRALLFERFWWPHLDGDIKWWIHACHTMPSSTDSEGLNTAYRPCTRPYLRQSLHGLYTQAPEWRLQVYCPRPLFQHALPRIPPMQSVTRYSRT
jgi:hypothetical protein